MTEEEYKKGEEFLEKFKALVIETVGTSNFEEASLDLLYFIQDKTSVFNPYIWADD